jgi:hypothetical protein
MNTHFRQRAALISTLLILLGLVLSLYIVVVPNAQADTRSLQGQTTPVVTPRTPTPTPTRPPDTIEPRPDPGVFGAGVAVGLVIGLAVGYYLGRRSNQPGPVDPGGSRRR